MWVVEIFKGKITNTQQQEELTKWKLNIYLQNIHFLEFRTLCGLVGRCLYEGKGNLLLIVRKLLIGILKTTGNRSQQHVDKEQERD